jgi:hypothetical protein
MRFLGNLAALGLIAALGTAQMAAQTIRVGTFHKQAIVVAFYRSPSWSDTLKQKMAELAAAKKAGDTTKAKELEAWGAAQQELAHRQLAGEAPISNILEALTPAFPAIAQKAEVAIIAPDLPYASAAVQTVDVTDLLLDWLKADDATRKIVRDLRQ